MSPSVLDGRIVKTSKGKVGSTALIRRRKYSWRDLLANYTKEIKYFYFDCDYTREGVHEDMEKLFKVGASPQEYGCFLNQPEFKKNLTEGEWNHIAQYYFASTALNFRVAIKKHNGYIVEAAAVEKGVGRFPRSNAITKDNLPVRPGEPYTFGNLTAFNPEEPYVSPPFRALVSTPKQSDQWIRTRSTIRRYGTNLPLENQPGSSRVEGYMALTEPDEVTTPKKIEIPSLRQLLKALLSMNKISMKAFAENLLPILILRRDEDMISHIFQTHGAESMEVKWYIGLLEIDLNKSLGYFFKTDKDYQYFYKKYKSHAMGPGYIKRVRQILIKGITTHLPTALTSQEAAALVAYTLQDGDITLELMQVLFPLTCTTSNIEEQYEILYGASVLDSPTRFTLKDLVSFGFRRNIHILALEAVIENNFEKASVLLPYTELALSSTQLQDLDLGAFSLSYGNVWDIVGKIKFGELLRRVEEETRDPNCRRNPFRVQDILSISLHLRNFELIEFTFDLVRTHSQLHGRGIESILMEFVHRMDLPKSSARIEGIFDQQLEIDGEEAERIKLFHSLLTSKRRNGQGSSIPSYVSPERLLHSAIWARNHSLVRYLIAIGTKLNEEDSLGESPIVTAILEKRDDGGHRTAAELRSEISIFIQLLEAKVDINCLNEFRIEMDGDLYQVDLSFLKAAGGINKTQIAKLWSSRFERVYDYDDDDDEIEIKLGDIRTVFLVPSINNNPPPLPFDQTTDERVLPELLIKLDKPTYNSEEEYDFLPRRHSINNGLRKTFLWHWTEYGRQHYTKWIWLFFTRIKGLGKRGGITPLHYAVHNGNLEMATCFIEHGASIHVRNSSAAEESRGMTRKLQDMDWEGDAVSALELAIKLGRMDFVALFLISDKEARSQALEMAQKHRQNHIVSLILSTWGESLSPPQKPRAQKWTTPRSRDIFTKNNQQRAILPKVYD
ncbi:hypothetical protein TWF173_009732 [Orbilia oligospora]|nr:hypothetical protein TWF173_009732 [Orbilia oligospora]